jgi:hypothetical protein
MLPKLEYYPVNWVDGMRIARKHFTESEHFVSDYMRDSTASRLMTYNYGLLSSNQPDFKLHMILIKVKMYACTLA